MIAVSTDEEGWKAVSPFINSLKMNFKVVLDDGETSKRYGLDVMPTVFLIDRNGRLAAKYIGLANRENMDFNIKRLQSEALFCARWDRAKRGAVLNAEYGPLTEYHATRPFHSDPALHDPLL